MRVARSTWNTLLLLWNILYIVDGRKIATGIFDRKLGQQELGQQEFGLELDRSGTRSKSGVWPFEDSHGHCDVTRTRHSFTASSSGTGTVKDLNIVDCGLNRFSDEESKKERSKKEREEDEANKELDEGYDRKLAELLDDAISWLRSYLDNDEVENDVTKRKGKNDENMDTRIVGGTKFQAGKWPWLAAVGKKSAGPKCGGTLIGRQWVISAAHCFAFEEKACEYNVRVGSVNWKQDTEDTHVDATVRGIYVHPDYNPKTRENDISLLRLDRQIELDKDSYVNSICLPNSARSVKPGTVCLAAGWGRHEEDRKMSNEALEVELPVIAYETGKCGDYKDGMVKDGMLCAGYKEGGKDTCQGDSGGPLIYKKDGRWYLLGLTSFGVGCAREDKPGIYIDVGHHLEWIRSTINTAENND